MNDDDWDVYKKIRKDTGDSDSEEEQEKGGIHKPCGFNFGHILTPSPV